MKRIVCWLFHRLWWLPGLMSERDKIICIRKGCGLTWRDRKSVV